MFGSDIRAMVPQIAMSAGTMLACACAEIVMGKHSNLGPINPHIDGKPAHGILKEFEQAKREIGQNPDSAAVWQPVIAQYPPTLIGNCQLAIEWSEVIVAEWLCDNKYAEYADKTERATRVISALTEQESIKSHKRHFHADYLADAGLRIARLENDSELQDLVLTVHHAAKLTFSGTPALKLVENQLGTSHITMLQSSKR